MGCYFIQKTRAKARSWKVQFQFYEGGRPRRRDVKLSEWRSMLGLDITANLDEVQARLDSLNAKEEIKRHEEKRNKIQLRMVEEQTIFDAYLSAKDVAEFEKSRLYARLSADERAASKLESIWTVARRVIVSLKIDPADWAENRGRFYDHFKKQQWSISWVQKVLPVINEWGRWQARRYKTYFDPIPFPTGREREKINDAYLDKNEKGMASDSITPTQLESAHSELSSELWNWIYLSVWFGLRPIEVDRLLKPNGKKTWWIESGATPILWVHQTKLTSVPHDKRSKGIPCGTPEQRRALKIVETQQFKRPLAKTIKSYFGERTTCYGGRKGFTDLMLSLGQSLEDISTWMGHQSIDRTWKSYKNKQIIKWKKAA